MTSSGSGPQGDSPARAVVRWAPSVGLLVAAVAIAVPATPDPFSMVLCGVLLVLAACLSPWLFPRSPDDAVARRRASDGGVPLIYWRPGCTYCLRLRLALGLRGNAAVWVDVSTDPDAAARVRAHNAGNETVPTVFIGEVGQTNPSPAWIRERLRVSR